MRTYRNAKRDAILLKNSNKNLNIAQYERFRQILSKMFAVAGRLMGTNVIGVPPMDDDRFIR